MLLAIRPNVLRNGSLVLPIRLCATISTCASRRMCPASNNVCLTVPETVTVNPIAVCALQPRRFPMLPPHTLLCDTTSHNNSVGNNSVVTIPCDPSPTR